MMKHTPTSAVDLSDRLDSLHQLLYRPRRNPSVECCH